MSEKGYEWIKTIGRNSLREQEIDSIVPNTWVHTLVDKEFFQKALGLSLPIIGSFALYVLSLYCPNVKTWLESWGCEIPDITASVLVSSTIVLTLWIMAKHGRKQRENHKNTLLYRGKYHDVLHYIRDWFCHTDHILTQQVSTMQIKTDKFLNHKYPSMSQMRTGKAEITEDIDRLRNTATNEMVRFFSGVCDEISNLLSFLTPGKNMGCCIRIATETKRENEIEGTTQIGGYSTVGWSNGLIKRCAKTEMILADEGIAKIISEGIAESTDNCVLLVESIERAVELGQWKKTANDEDPSISSVMILPINFRRPVPKDDERDTNMRIDGLLYITSQNADNLSPFSSVYAKEVADVAAALADVLGCLVYRLNRHRIQIEAMKKVVNARESKDAV